MTDSPLRLFLVLFFLLPLHQLLQLTVYSPPLMSNRLTGAAGMKGLLISPASGSKAVKDQCDFLASLQLQQ